MRLNRMCLPNTCLAAVLVAAALAATAHAAACHDKYSAALEASAAEQMAGDRRFRREPVKMNSLGVHCRYGGQGRHFDRINVQKGAGWPL
jgi:hypothetical protein